MSLVRQLIYPLTRRLAHNRLSKLYRETAVAEERIIRFGPNDKFILFSDCHRGDNSWKDDYAPNRNLHLYALDYYNRKDFTYIELGDGDELFENKDFKAIAFAHRDVFYQMRELYCDAPPPEADKNAQYQSKKDPRFYMIYGNHDIQRRKARVVQDQLHKFFIEYKKRDENMFPDLKVHEGLILRYEHYDVHQDIFLVHGHQGDWFNDYLWWLALVTVRFVWGPMQQFIGWRDPTMPLKPYKIDNWGVEKRIAEWVANEDQMLICGHTHRSQFSDADDPAYYFNTGSCIHPRVITGIEIQNGTIALIKWELAPREEDGVLHIVRDVLVGPKPLSAYYKGS